VEVLALKPVEGLLVLDDQGHLLLLAETVPPAFLVRRRGAHLLLEELPHRGLVGDPEVGEDLLVDGLAATGDELVAADRQHRSLGELGYAGLDPAQATLPPADPLRAVARVAALLALGDLR